MITRLYSEKIISDLTLSEVAALIADDDIEYCGDYGFKSNGKEAKLIFSMN